MDFMSLAGSCCVAENVPLIAYVDNARRWATDSVSYLPTNCLIIVAVRCISSPCAASGTVLCAPHLDNPEKELTRRGAAFSQATPRILAQYVNPQRRRRCMQRDEKLKREES